MKIMYEPHIYCCCCNSLVAIEMAEHVYTTGFYKVVIPLGECRKCAEAKENAAWLPFAAASDPPPGYESMCV